LIKLSLMLLPLGLHVAVAQVPLSKHIIMRSLVSKPGSQMTSASAPNVVTFADTRTYRPWDIVGTLSQSLKQMKETVL